MDEVTIGDRLRKLRKWRGKTLKEVADLAGFSKSFLSAVERGQCALDRRSHIAGLAAALRVSETDIIGGPHLSADPIQSGPHLCIPALRVAIQTNSLGQAIIDRARPLDELADAIRQLQPLRRADDFTAMGAKLPDLIDELHWHVAQPADEAAQRLALATLVDACHYTSTIAKCLRYPDLAWGASQRGLAAAQMLDDPTVIGKAYFSLVLATPRDIWGRALTISECAANALEPNATAGESLEVLGMATLNAAWSAAAVNDHERAKHWLQEAHKLGERVPDEPNCTWEAFSATNVAIWKIGLFVEAGASGGDVLELAKDVNETKLETLPFRKAGYLSHTGRGLARDPRMRSVALDWLRDAEAAAPQRIRNDAEVHETVAVMLKQAHTAAVGRELRGMAARMGIPH